MTIDVKLRTHELTMKRLIIGLLLLANIAVGLLEVGQVNANVGNVQDISIVDTMSHFFIATSDANEVKDDTASASNGNHTAVENEYASLLESIHESNTIDEVLHHAEEVTAIYFILYCFVV